MQQTSFVYRTKEVCCNDIRSVLERVIYLRYDIALRAMIYASRMNGTDNCKLSSSFFERL